MMKYFLCALMLVAGTMYATAQPQRRQLTPGDTLTSFTANPDGSGTFRFYAPNAKYVQLGGEIEGKTVGKSADGVWTMVTAPNARPDVYRYFFIVDGAKVYDPKNPIMADFHPTVDVVRPGSDLFWQKRDVPHGMVTIAHYKSNATKTERRVHVWTPPGYFTGNEKLPVLYLLHGGGDNDTYWTESGKAGWILDNLFAEGKITPMVVVMPDGGIPVETFAQDLGESIIPYVESNFRVYNDTPHRAIAGLSMGGMETLETIVRYPGKFSYVIIMSSGLFANTPEAFAKYEKRVEEAAPTMKKNFKYFLFTDGGPTDMATRNTQPTRAIFAKYGINSDYSQIADGGHTMYVWRYDLHSFAQKLFR
ncbi:MAG: endo-1,4-beta-xylanase Z [Prevotellaceae bacterium]|nr:endo-1,4-beta-xylanase Z [Prevotellaceae bacterium]